MPLFVLEVYMPALISKTEYEPPENDWFEGTVIGRLYRGPSPLAVP
jgi:hypothetical protein